MALTSNKRATQKFRLYGSDGNSFCLILDLHQLTGKLMILNRHQSKAGFFISFTLLREQLFPLSVFQKVSDCV